MDFTTEGAYDFLEFPAILGEAQILLDGVQVDICHVDCRRSFRLHVPVTEGTHTLTVCIKRKNGAHVILSNARIGRYRMPAVSHKLFSGRMLVILERKSAGHLTVTHENGITATYEIK